MDTTTLYVILGGSITNMTLRAGKVFALLGAQPGTILVAGLPAEKEWMQQYCHQHGHTSIEGAGSWDTLTNITRDIIPSLQGYKTNTIKVIAPTGRIHSKRIQKAWSIYGTQWHKKVKLHCPSTGEADGPHESKLLFLYRIGWPMIQLLSWTASIRRP